jgi:hypothetical protein
MALSQVAQHPQFPFKLTQHVFADLSFEELRWRQQNERKADGDDDGHGASMT